MTDHSDLRRFGYYKVNELEFTVLSDAVFAASNDWSKITFHFNDKIYDQFDWTKDPCPHLSLKDLYKRRAQQLRDEFDYVVIMCSGGPDSMNVLDTFCSNNIHVDEVINYNSYGSTQIVAGTIHNADYVYNFKPAIEQYQRHGQLNAKITIYDEVEFVKKHWQTVSTVGWDDIATDFGGPTMWLARGHSHRYNPELWKKIQNGDKVCVINGADKPSSMIINGRRALIYHDMPVGNFKEIVTSNMYNFNSIASTWQWFYQAPETAELQIKQSYILNQFCKAHPEPIYYTKPSNDLRVRPGNSWPSVHGHGHLKYDIFHRLIYPNWNPKYVTPKPADLILRPQDNWWMDKFDDKDKSLWTSFTKKFLKQNFEKLRHDKLLGTSFKTFRYIE